MTNNIYGLVRVSTKEQNEARQVERMLAVGVLKQNIIIEIAHLILNKDSDDPLLKKKIESGNHGNLIKIYKDNTVIKKEQILKLQEEFSKTSLIGGARVFIINDVETLNPSSANALLKFLEEPKNNQTYGLLVANSLDLVLPTIISRSQVISLVSKENIYDLCIENNISPKMATFIQYKTDSLKEALELNENDLFIQIVDAIDKIINSLYKNEIQDRLTLSKMRQIITLSKDGYTMLLNILIDLYSDAMKYQNNLKINLLYYEEAIKLLSTKPLSTLIEISQSLENLDKMKNFNVNLSMQYEYLLTILQE